MTIATATEVQNQSVSFLTDSLIGVLKSDYD